MTYLKECRQKLDQIDREILEKFTQRMKTVEEIAQYKKENNLPVLDIGREREILMWANRNAPQELSMHSVTLFRTLMELSRARQRDLLNFDGKNSKLIETALQNTPDEFPTAATVACMGSEGANGQIACDKIFKVADIVYFRNFSGVCQAVSKGICEYGILPIDNTTTGTVDEVYDLMCSEGFYIVRSLRLQIAHVLLTKGCKSIREIKEIFSHEQAIKQCSVFFHRHPEIKITVCDSTSEAARRVAESDRTDIAAISAKECAKLYDLEISDEKIQNSDFNYTRFICISKTPQIYPGANKISLLAVLPHKPGALYEVLAKFSVLGLNLTKLESRPTPGREFEYTFYFDFEASAVAPGIASLLDDLEKSTEKLLFLGNYQEL